MSFDVFFIFGLLAEVEEALSRQFSMLFSGACVFALHDCSFSMFSSNKNIGGDRENHTESAQRRINEFWKVMYRLVDY